jgi:hypothetical protein
MPSYRSRLYWDRRVDYHGRAQILRPELERKLRPAPAHLRERQPGRPVLGNEAEHGHLAHVPDAGPTELHGRADAVRHRARAPVRPHPFRHGGGAGLESGGRHGEYCIEIERAAEGIALGGRAAGLVETPEPRAQRIGDAVGNGLILRLGLQLIQ